MTKIESFLELYAKENTKGVYRAGLLEFFDFLYGKQRKGKKVRKEEMLSYEKLAERYLNEGRDYFSDLLRFASSLSKKPPITAKSYITAVKEFLAENGIEFSQKELKRIRLKLPKGNARTVEKDMDHETLRTILQHLDVKGKAIVLTLASSGMRIGECLKVRLEDLNLETDPAEIVIRGEYTKTGEQRIVFISREAKQMLKEWLKIRKSYLASARNRNKGLVEKGIAKQKQANDDRLFPFSDQTVSQLWENALRKAGLLSVDRTTKRKQLHIHMLRKFFRSQLALAVPVDIVEALMGHSAYLTEAYRRYTKKQIAEYYKKGEHLITIQIPKEIKEIESEFRQELNENRKLIEGLVKENMELKERLRRLERFEEEIKAANELFAEIVQTGMISKLKEMFELVKAMEEKPEIKQILMDLKE